jgi:dihydrofolate reductase
MGHLIISNAISLNGAFEAPSPPPDGWLVLDSGWMGAALEMWQAADAMVMGRKTYEGLAAVWPQLVKVPGYEAFAQRMNSMPKYVASRTLRAPLTWNATLLEGDPAARLNALKQEHHGHLIVTGAGELAHHLLTHGVVDELRFMVSPYLWPTGPRIFERLGAVRLELVGTTTFPSGGVQLRYRPAPGGGSSAQ